MSDELGVHIPRGLTEHIADLMIAEAKKPGMMSLAGKVSEVKLRNQVQAYFNHLAHQTVVAGWDNVVNENKELAVAAALIKAQQVTRRNSELLKGILYAHSFAAMLKADKQHAFGESVEDEERDDHGRWTSSGGGAGWTSGEGSHGLGTPKADEAIDKWTNSLAGEQPADEIANALADKNSELGNQLRQVSKETQKHLPKTLTLYRGVGGTQADAEGLVKGETSHMNVNAVSSWTSDPAVAKIYADQEGPGYGRVMQAKVPRSMVLWRSQGNAEFGNQKEYVLYNPAKIIRGKFKESWIAEAEGDDPGIDHIGLTAEQASAYAEKHAAEVVKGIDEVTQKKIQDAVAQAIDEQLGIPGLEKLLSEVVGDRARAKLIARTEMADAFGEASMQKLARLDVPYKQLIPSPDACEICLGIVEAGPVPLDEPFMDDDGEEYDRSPIHPGCRCATVGARAPEEEQ